MTPDRIEDAQPPRGMPLRNFKRRLLAGAAAIAIIASGSAYTLHAYSADVASPFGQTSAARVPAPPISMPGFSDLVAAVKPAVVSVRVRADAGGHATVSEGDANPFEGTPFEKYFKNFGLPSDNGAQRG